MVIFDMRGMDPSNVLSCAEEKTHCREPKYPSKHMAMGKSLMVIKAANKLSLTVDSFHCFRQ